jgi:hypothetical protein
MTKAEKLFHEIAAGMPEAKESKMFGSLCIKAPNGKAFAIFKNDDMVFKLEEKELDTAMKMKGAKVFDPMDGRPMKGWVQLSPDHAVRWPDLAARAMEYVRKLEK